MPVISSNGCRIESSALTETKLYLKAVTDRLTLDVKVGDPVQAGLVISNSEVGLGSVKVEPMVYRLRCLNGMIARDFALHKYHVGRASDVDIAEEFFRDATRKADDKAFWMKVYDVVKGTFNRDIFSKIVDRMRDATERNIEGNPVKAI